MGECCCKNACERIAIKVFSANAYDGNVYCSRCCVWLKKSDLWKVNRCPCCHQNTRQKKRYLRTKEKEIKRIC